MKESLYRGICLSKDDAFRLSPGAVELLDQLCAEKVPRAIATASGKGNLVSSISISNLISDSISRKLPMMTERFLENRHRISISKLQG